MIDRGPDSKGVIETIRALVETHPGHVIALSGNHEWLAIDAISRQSYDSFYLWMINGGDATQNSYPSQKMTDDDIKWMASLPLSHEEPGFFFSHAPVPRQKDRSYINKNLPFTKNELIWTYYSDEKKHAKKFKDKIGVCGHVHALKKGIKEPRFYAHYIFADAGCGCAKDAPLVAVEVQTRDVIYAHPKIE
jgi:hypothetical protein